MQASLRDCAIVGSLHGTLRNTRIVRVLNEFCRLSERIIYIKKILTLVDIIEDAYLFLYREL